MLTVLVPRQAPKVVPIASDKSAFLIFGTFPSLSNILAFVATPTSVPIVSNISINNNVNKTISMSIENILCHSNFINTELIDGGALIMASGKFVIPIGIPIIAVIIIPINNAPLTFLAINIPVITIPIIASNAGPFVISPSDINVPSPLTITPAPSSPITAINKPIPTEMAFLIFSGIESTIASRTLKAVSKINIIPSKNTAVNAN
ncbi:hypothetical protein SDC9_130496 [bioreactor metagenome]|uniref:Uncharacterized protein n=1 Tax=bioreactor metagenome TaxID=1076179 RepID=A0A645D464_9ZZZZ